MGWDPCDNKVTVLSGKNNNTSAQYTPDSETITTVLISVSYDRVLQVSTDGANRLIEIYNNEGIVCPISLYRNLFTTGHLDYIDHNPSCT